MTKKRKRLKKQIRDLDRKLNAVGKELAELQRHWLLWFPILRALSEEAQAATLRRMTRKEVPSGEEAQEAPQEAEATG